MSDDHTLIFFTTEGCHLCDRALDQLWPVLEGSRWQLQTRDIADSDDLLARYGERIPVLKRCDVDEELGWPFDSDDISAWLHGGVD